MSEDDGTATVNLALTAGAALVLASILSRSDGSDGGDTVVPDDRIEVDGDLALTETQALLTEAFIEDGNGGFTGTGYINFDSPDDAGSVAYWPLFVTAPGEYALDFRYALDDPDSRTADLHINDTTIPVTASPTGAWTNWETQREVVDLPEGEVDLSIETIGFDWGNLDLIDVIADPSADGGTGDGTGDTDDGTEVIYHPFSWAETHTRTAWLHNANANNNLRVEKVTSLDLEGPGSITAAVNRAGSDPAVIVFEVGGVIDIGGGPYWRMREPNTYFAGQTAPWPGITFIRGGPRIQASRVIMQHVSVVTGNDVNDPHASRAITVNQGCDDVLIDHCLAAQAPDTNVNFRGESARKSFINSMTVEPLNHSSHPESPHGYAYLFRDGERKVTSLGNLIAHAYRRLPRPNDATAIHSNNYTYNWEAWAIKNGGYDCELDMVSNVFEAGADTRNTVFDGTALTVYSEDNQLISSDYGWGDSNVDYVNSPMHVPPGLDLNNLVPSAELEDFIVACAGPRPGDRAPYAQRVIDDFVSKSGRVIDAGDIAVPNYSPATRSLSPPSTDVLGWLQQYTDEVL